MSERQTKAGNQEHSLTLTLFYSFTLSFTHYRRATCWTTLVFMSMLQNHSHTFTLSHSHERLFACLCSTVTLYRWKWQWLYLDKTFHLSFFMDSSTISTDITVHRAGSQL